MCVRRVGATAASAFAHFFIIFVIRYLIDLFKFSIDASYTVSIFHKNFHDFIIYIFFPNNFLPYIQKLLIILAFING